MIRSLFYVSRRVGGAAFPDREIEDILAAARRRNLSLGVTGALTATPAYFAQVLEGSDPHVGIILDYIRHDPRHRDLRIVVTEEVAARRFGNWSMAHLPPTTEVTIALAMLIDEAQDAPQVANSFIALLQQSTGARLPS